MEKPDLILQPQHHDDHDFGLHPGASKSSAAAVVATPTNQLDHQSILDTLKTQT
jgi:hypothetical protein